MDIIKKHKKLSWNNDICLIQSLKFANHVQHFAQNQVLFRAKKASVIPVSGG